VARRTLRKARYQWAPRRPPGRTASYGPPPIVPTAESPDDFARGLAGRLGAPLLRPGEGLPDRAPFAARELSQVLPAARSVQAHVFDLLGSGRCELGPRIDWSLDFKGGCRWPLEHFSRLPVRLRPGCDVKVPWELGRFNHVAPLVQAYALTGEGEWAVEVQEQVRDFIERNPVEYGVQWMSAMDVAIRAVNWIYALLVLAAGPHLSYRMRERWLTSLWHHGRFVRRNLSANPHGPGNHYLSELVGLLHVGLVFGYAGEGIRLAEFALGRLAREMRRQVYSDGTSWEASTNYHRLVTELFAQAQLVARGTSVELRVRLGPAYEARLERMLELIRDYTRPDGTAPLIGDVDDGRLLAFAGYDLDPRWHWRSLAVYRERRPGPEPTSAFREEGGLIVLRSPESVIAIRCGRVGLNGRGAHDHADQLSVDVTLAGVPLFVDPGSYVYTADERARAWFRSTAAHNTIEIDGRDQMIFSELGFFEVERRATGVVEKAQRVNARLIFRGRHDGYTRLAPPVVHRRQVILEGSGRRVLIDDWLEGPAAPHRVRASFQLAAGCFVERQGDASAAVTIIGSDGRRFLWRASRSAGLALELEDGWVSPRYGVRHAAPRLALCGELTVPTRLGFEITVVE
jgi:uncharacterized heparinase superfamily protein